MHSHDPTVWLVPASLVRSAGDFVETAERLRHAVGTAESEFRVEASEEDPGAVEFGTRYGSQCQQLFEQVRAAAEGLEGIGARLQRTAEMVRRLDDVDVGR